MTKSVASSQSSPHSTVTTNPQRQRRQTIPPLSAPSLTSCLTTYYQDYFLSHASQREVWLMLLGFIRLDLIHSGRPQRQPSPRRRLGKQRNVGEMGDVILVAFMAIVRIHILCHTIPSVRGECHFLHQRDLQSKWWPPSPPQWQQQQQQRFLLLGGNGAQALGRRRQQQPKARAVNTSVMSIPKTDTTAFVTTRSGAIPSWLWSPRSTAVTRSDTNPSSKINAISKQGLLPATTRTPRWKLLVYNHHQPNHMQEESLSGSTTSIRTTRDKYQVVLLPRKVQITTRNHLTTSTARGDDSDESSSQYPCIGSGSYGMVQYVQIVNVAQYASVATTDIAAQATTPDATTTTTTTTTVATATTNMTSDATSISRKTADQYPCLGWFVGKRAWGESDLKQRICGEEGNDGADRYSNGNNLMPPRQQQKQTTKQQLQDISSKAKRCQSYWETEQYCLEKLAPYSEGRIVPYRGIGVDEEGRSWMIFDILTGMGQQSLLTKPQQQSSSAAWLSQFSERIAPSLADLIEQDRIDHKRNEQHHLYVLSQALGLRINDEDGKEEVAGSNENDNDSDCDSLVKTLDVVILDVLEALRICHEHNIVHRDIKPANLLVTQRGVDRRHGMLVLIDFGSAADLTPQRRIGPFVKRQGYSDTVVAISPVYAAPELFIDPNDVSSALKFDCFSAGLLFCQLLFQYLDERQESGFHQQLAACNNDLDTWLLSAMQGKVRPMGLMDALDVLRQRPGLWRLLRSLLQTRPVDRISSADAVKDWKAILARQAASTRSEMSKSTEQPLTVDTTYDDGAYLREVLEQSELCAVPPVVWPLHFVATFRRNKPLGLILAETVMPNPSNNNDGEDEEMDSISACLWADATKNATTGEVFVRAIVPGGQADELGIFRVGDRLQGVGELPLAGGGFEKAVRLLQDQPIRAQYVTLHFDRKSALSLAQRKQRIAIYEGPIVVSDQGAWSSLGRRQSQEDELVLHEVHDTQERSILLAGVMDGHLGRAAANFVLTTLPQEFSDELIQSAKLVPAENILKNSWERTCQSYQSICHSGSECVADYDSREGILLANTGSVDAIAGTTATIIALDKQTSHLVFLNCGDSRGLVVDANAQIQYVTRDHTPEEDIKRLRDGMKEGLPYSEPQCRLSRWRIPVGDYEYAVARSLEGPFATSRGIVSTPDVNVMQAESRTTLLVATDGLWEVMDTEQVAKILTKLRFRERLSAGDAAKSLCSVAIEKGSLDNVSAVVVYLE